VLAAESSAAARDRSSATTNWAKPSVSDSVAIDMEVAAQGNAITNQLKAIGQNKEGASAGGNFHASIFILSGVLLGVLLIAVKLGPTVAAIFANRKSTAWIPAPSAPMSPAEKAADEQVFAEFAAGFRVGPGGAKPKSIAVEVVTEQPDSRSVTVKPEPARTRPEPAVTRRPLSKSEFIDAAPRKIKNLRTYLQECSRITGLGRQKIITELVGEIDSLKAGAADASLLPLWQLASALEGLIKQMEEKPHSVTPSTMRTVAGAVDLFESLLSPIAGPELLSTPPVKFLAVDDDPISRHTISFALKRALTAPHVAENGPAGLALAAVNTYDVIFLDVQMPEMDGFEVCSRLHQTETNATTPVVFVTCSSDFNSRATSTLVGGNDLIGKPFLTFEIAVKALTLALRTRLGTARAQPCVPNQSPAGPKVKGTAAKLEETNALLETA
jgi:CheY-like chemotaxis protein